MSTVTNRRHWLKADFNNSQTVIRPPWAVVADTLVALQNIAGVINAAMVYQEYKETIHYSNRSGVRAICPDCHVPIAMSLRTGHIS